MSPVRDLPTSRLLSAVALVLVLALPLSGWIPVEPRRGVRLLQIGYVLGAIGWLIVVWQTGTLRWRLPNPRKVAPAFTTIVAVALLARLLMLATPLSDDVYRYVWEGRVRLHGFNPYVVAPDSEQLVPLRAVWWDRINHPSHAAIYPPLAQTLFTALAWWSPQPGFFRLIFLIADVATLALLARWLQRRTGDARSVAVYALCPLALQAFAGEGHVDALMLLGLALLLNACDRPALKELSLADAATVGAAFGLAVGIKWVALVIGPWLLVRLLSPWQGSRSVGRLLSALAPFAVIVFAPFIAYVEHGWRPIFEPLQWFATRFHSLDWTRQALLSVFPPNAVRSLSVVLVTAVALGVAARRTTPASALLWPLGALALLLSTIHPWYFTWLLPALCVRRTVAWFMLVLTLVFAYEGQHVLYDTGVWKQPPWVAPAVFIPFYVTLLLEAGLALRRRWRRRVVGRHRILREAQKIEVGE